MPVWWEYVRDALSMRPHTHAALPDLRGLEVERVRVKGTHYLPHDRERERTGDRLYVLRRQPHRRHDPSATAVYARGRGVGYLSTTRAVALAPLLDRIGGAAVVNGLGSADESFRLWLELPTVDALRAYVQAREAD